MSVTILVSFLPKVTSHIAVDNGLAERHPLHAGRKESGGRGEGGVGEMEGGQWRGKGWDGEDRRTGTANVLIKS